MGKGLRQSIRRGLRAEGKQMIGETRPLAVRRQPRQIGPKRRPRRPNAGCVGYYGARGLVSQKWR